MKPHKALLIAIVAFVCVSGSSGADKTYPSLTTVGGTIYENVRVTRVDRDSVYITHKSGSAKVLFDELSDGIRKDLGLPTKEEVKRQHELDLQRQVEEERRRLQRQAEEERRRSEKQMEEKRQKELAEKRKDEEVRRFGEQLRRFAEEQKAKGLVPYQGQWMTPAQREEKEFIAKADEIVSSKFRQNAHFRILQPLPNGALCVMGGYSRYDGEVFFLIGLTNKVLSDEDKFASDLYWAGTYTYTTRQHIEKTVNCYSPVRDVAHREVRSKFGLFAKGKDSTTSPPGSIGGPVIAGNELKGFASGFIITKDGFILTNHHVVKNAAQVKVKTEKGTFVARIVAQDTQNDVALLKVDGEFIPVTFASERTAKLGQTVFTVGFPMPEIQGFAPKVTKGVISSLSGIHDDVRRYQIDASVQPGNSGGPLADECGNVVGVVVSRINAALVLENTGSLPQNVNYSVKRSYIMALIDNYPDVSKQIQVAENSSSVSFADAVEKVRTSTVLVIVY